MVDIFLRTILHRSAHTVAFFYMVRHIWFDYRVLRIFSYKSCARISIGTAPTTFWLNSSVKLVNYRYVLDMERMARSICGGIYCGRMNIRIFSYKADRSGRS